MKIEHGDKLLVRVTKIREWEVTFDEQFYQWSIETNRFEGTRQKFVEHIMVMGRTERYIRGSGEAEIISKITTSD